MFNINLVPAALQRRNAQTLEDSSYSYKIDSVILIKNCLNPEGNQNHITGSKVTAIILKGQILPIGGVALGRICVCSRQQAYLLKYTKQYLCEHG